MDTSPDGSVPMSQHAVEELTIARERFNRSTQNLVEAISGFVPAEGMMTTAQQVAHTARVIDWFMEGAFRPEGFDMNFEEQSKQVMAVESLAAAREWFDKAIANGIALLGSQSDADLMMPLPAGSVMGGMPRMAIVSAITDHTAHHRGALTAYARINHIVPADPFGM